MQLGLLRGSMDVNANAVLTYGFKGAACAAHVLLRAELPLC